MQAVNNNYDETACIYCIIHAFEKLLVGEIFYIATVDHL